MVKESNYYLEIEEDDDILNDDEVNSKKQNLNKPTKKKSKKLKWTGIILFVVLLYLFYDTLLGYFFTILKLNPAVYRIYLNLEYQIANNTLTGLLYISILGSLFFLTIPSEALFIYYLTSTQYFFFFILVILIFGNVIGLIFNYLFGRILGENLMRKVFSKNFDKYKNRIDKYGGLVIFFGNILPGPIEVLSIFYGSFKFNFSRYVFLSFMGRLIKYSILFLLYIYFWDQITLFYGDVLYQFSRVKF